MCGSSELSRERPPEPTQRRGSGRQLQRLGITLALAVCISLAAMGFWLSEPPHRVSGSSMAPSLLGPHYELDCRRCGFLHRFDGCVPPPTFTVCGNCGYSRNDAATARKQPGERLRIEPIPFDQIARFDRIILEDPRNNQLIVKRIAFLPGEHPIIRGGDLYDADRRVPRGRPPQTQLLVFDQAFDVPEHSRFRVEGARSTDWKIEPGKLCFLASRSEDSAWLGYQHLACLGPPLADDVISPPHDSYAYNPRVARNLHAIRDLWIEMEVGRFLGRRLNVSLRAANREWVITLDIENQEIVWQTPEGVVKSAGPAHIQGAVVRAGHLDGRMYIEVGSDVVRCPIESNCEDLGAEPIALQIEGGPAELTDVKIYRDIHWLGPYPSDSDVWDFGRELGPSEVFVLGDNVPISEDSRGNLGAVDIRWIRGRVLATE